MTSCNSDDTYCDISMIINETVTNMQVSYTYQCLYATYTFGSLRIDKDIVVYVSIATDLIMAIGIVMFLFSEKAAEDR